MFLEQSEATAARRRILVYLVDDTDGKTPETAVTISAGDVKISKNGAAEANHAGTLVELAGGRYYYEHTQAEQDTLGLLTFALAKAGVRTFIKESQVVPWDPYAANLPADVKAVDGNAAAATILSRHARGVVRGTCGAGSTTTSIVTSSLDPAASVNDQFNAKVLTFDKDTTTANLRGQSTTVSDFTSGGVITVVALTNAPASGDTFTIA